MVAGEGNDRSADRERYARGMPDHHDPTAGWGGAPPARSALTLRLVLAVFGLLVGVVFAVWAWAVDAPAWVVVLPALVALSAVVDLLVLLRRKGRGEPG